MNNGNFSKMYNSLMDWLSKGKSVEEAAQKGWTQQEIAQEFGVSTDTIQRLKSGEFHFFQFWNFVQ